MLIKYKDGEDLPKLEIVEVVLAHCNLVNSNYQQATKVLFTFLFTFYYLHIIFTFTIVLTIKHYCTSFISHIS